MEVNGMIKKVFVVNANDSISVSEGKPGAPKRDSKMPEILKTIEGANFSAAEVRHLLAKEVALLVKEMSEYEYDGTLASRVKSCTAQINALGALEKVLEKVGRNEGVLNLNGPQFRYAFFRIRNMFKEATEKVCGHDSVMWNKIINEFKAELKMNDQEIRRKTAEWYSSSGGDQRPWTDI
jgi:hypothetical protein